MRPAIGTIASLGRVAMVTVSIELISRIKTIPAMRGSQRTVVELDYLARMSEEELKEAIQNIINTASNIGSHAARDDYVVGMWRLAHRYEVELERRIACEQADNGTADRNDGS